MFLPEPCTLRDPRHIENMLDNGSGLARGSKSPFDQEIPRATVVDGNLISNVGDGAARSARLYFNQKWQDGVWGGGSKGMSGNIR